MKIGFDSEKYLEEQLVSIARQTRKAEEVLIVDDCSSDATIRIAEQFVRDHDLGDSWCITLNSYHINHQDSMREYSRSEVHCCFDWER